MLLVHNENINSFCERNLPCLETLKILDGLFDFLSIELEVGTCVYPPSQLHEDIWEGVGP